MIDGKRMTKFRKLVLTVLACSLASVTVNWTPALAQGESRNVSILYTGDVQGHLTSFYYDSRKPVGGIAKRAIYFQDKRRHKNMTWLALDSGDAISGTPLSNSFQGYLDIQAMNRLKYDAMCLGVHEFDYGVDVLKQRMSEAEFPILSANVVYADTGQPFAVPYIILNRDGFRIAIFGLTTSEIDDQLPANKFAGLQVKDPLETARILVPQLAAQSDIIIALTHLGIDEDIQLSSKLQEIDVIVGGMSHSELQVPMKVGRTLIVHDGEYGRNVGLLKLAFQPSGADWENKYFDSLLEPMGGKWVENSNYLDWLAGYESQLGERMSRLVGSSSQRFSNLKVFSSETELGNYVADVLRSKSGADVSLLPAAFFKDELPSGDITIGEIYTALPYDHYGVVLTVTGAELLEILSAGAGNIGKPGFPQVSGLSFGIANSKAYDVMVNGVALDMFKSYSLATTDFLSKGNLGYATLGTITQKRNTGYLVRDMVVDTLGAGQIATSKLSGRINFIVRDSEPQYTAGSNVPATDSTDSSTIPVADNAPLDDMPGQTPIVDDIPATDTIDNPETDYLPETSTAPPPSGDDELLNGRVLYDRNGNPIVSESDVVDDPVQMAEDTLDDAGSEVLETAEETVDPDGVISDVVSEVRDVEQPISSGSLPDILGSETLNANGLQYVFTLLPGNAPNKYQMKLDIINTSAQRVQIDYSTSEHFDFLVMDDQNLVWNFNNPRFFVQSDVSQTLNPGDKLSFEADWARNTNGDQLVSPGVYRFVAEHKLKESPVRVEFTLNLI
jgi:2',3'-cyclic-nucleotide 2'-phosphodiesterase (5'-nucleotidase family)